MTATKGMSDRALLTQVASSKSSQQKQPVSMSFYEQALYCDDNVASACCSAE